MSHTNTELITSPPPPIASVLVVDDCQKNWLMVRSILEQFDLELTYAPNGEIALAMAKLVHFDVILMDHSLPGLQGDEVTRQIRTTKTRNTSSSIIAFTSEPDLVDPRAGYNGLLGKPFTAIDLTTAILVALVEQEAVNAGSPEVNCRTPQTRVAAIKGKS